MGVYEITAYGESVARWSYNYWWIKTFSVAVGSDLFKMRQSDRSEYCLKSSPNTVVPRQLKCLIAVGLLIAVIIPLSAGAEGTPLSTGHNLSELETHDAVLVSSVTSDPPEINFQALAEVRLKISRMYFANWLETEAAKALLAHISRCVHPLCSGIPEKTRRDQFDI